MSRLRRTLALACLLAPGLPAQSHDWKIVPGERVGPLTAASTIESLRVAFGAANVRAGSVTADEGFEEPGAVIYPDSPSRALGVVWGEEKAAGHPAYVFVCYGQQSAGPCEWKTGEGITNGTSLAQLEKWNGRPFRLAGFGWDYSGAVLSWNGGRLEALVRPAGRVGLRLAPADSALDGPGAQRSYRQVLGDRSFSSGHPAMQALNPRVYSILVTFSQ
jgi:hypothetical protein